MTAPLRLLTGLFVGVLSLLLGTGVAAGCSCVGQTTAEQVAAADVVARVVVERVSIPDMEASTGQMASYKLLPSYVWKGDVVSQFTVVSEPDGASCGLEGISEGDDVVVFATLVNESLTASLCGGTAQASDAFVAELLDVVGHGKAIDAVPGDEAGAWIVPTVSALAGVVLVGGVLIVFWILPRRRT